MAKELARLEVSKIRRVSGAAVQIALAAFVLLSVALLPSPFQIWNIFLAVFGFALLWFSWRYWNATGTYLFLTAEGLFDSAGKHFCSLDQIAKVDRGLFAFRPSGGFTLKLSVPIGRGWAPGIWWSFGKTLGIGGATSRPAGKQMADIISVMLTERGAEILEMNKS